MIYKIASRGNGEQLGKYMITQNENERVEPFVYYGCDPDIVQACIDFDNLGKLAKSKKGIAHSQVCPGPKYSNKMTDDEWQQAILIQMEEQGLAGQPFTSSKHFKKGEIHVHLAISRYDPATGKLKSDSNSFRKNDRARERAEITLGHDRTRGKDPMHKQVQKDAFEAWQSTRTGPGFVEEMNRRGYTIAKSSQKRPFQIIPHETGITYELTRKLKNRETETYIKANEVWKRLDGMDLPNDKDIMNRIAVVKAAKQEVRQEAVETERERKRREFMEQWKSAREKGRDNEYSM